MALTCSRLVSIESLGAWSLPSFAGAASAFLVAAALAAALVVVVSAFVPAFSFFLSSYFYSGFSALADAALDAWASAAFSSLSTADPPPVTINFYRRT
jgi:hypothetical protein